MKAKEYLSQAFYLDRQINAKLEQVYQLRELAKRATSTFTAERVSGTPQRSPMENAMVKLMDMEKEIDMDIDRLVDLKREMAGLLVQLESPAHRLSIELPYFSNKSWEDVAKSMGFEVRWVQRLHGRALQEFDALLEKKYMSGNITTPEVSTIGCTMELGQK